MAPLSRILLLLAACILVGCGRSGGDAHDHDDHAGHDHGELPVPEETDANAHDGHHHGPNGGEVVFSAAGAPALEYRRDTGTGEMTLWLWAADQKTALRSDVAPKLSIYTFDGPKNVSFSARDADSAGLAQVFHATAPDLQAAVLKGRFTLKVDGQTYLIKIDEGDPHAGHDH